MIVCIAWVIAADMVGCLGSYHWVLGHEEMGEYQVEAENQR